MLHDIRSLRWETDSKTIKRMTKAPLEHRFGNHMYCDSKWCRFLKAEEDGKIYTPPESDPFFCKQTEPSMYKQLKEIMEKFTSEEVIRESLHWNSTQKNEAMNQVIARLCPKYKHLSESLTLLTRVCVAISYTNIGMTNFYTQVLNELGINVDIEDQTSQLLYRFLHRLDQIRTERGEQKRTREYKAKRIYHDNVKSKEEIYLNRISDKKYGTYQTGIALESGETEFSYPADFQSSLPVCPNVKTAPSQNYLSQNEYDCGVNHVQQETKHILAPIPKSPVTRNRPNSPSIGKLLTPAFKKPRKEKDQMHSLLAPTPLVTNESHMVKGTNSMEESICRKSSDSDATPLFTDFETWNHQQISERKNNVDPNKNLVKGTNSTEESNCQKSSGSNATPLSTDFETWNHQQISERKNNVDPNKNFLGNEISGK